MTVDKGWNKFHRNSAIKLVKFGCWFSAEIFCYGSLMGHFTGNFGFSQRPRYLYLRVLEGTWGYPICYRHQFWLFPTLLLRNNVFSVSLVLWMAVNTTIPMSASCYEEKTSWRHKLELYQFRNALSMHWKQNTASLAQIYHKLTQKVI